MSQRLDWERARQRDRVRGGDVDEWKDSGEVFLPDGTITSARKILVAERMRLMDRLTQCVHCGELKNQHHFTTKPGRERRICAKCVHEMGLSQTASVKAGPAADTRTKTRRLVARFESSCTDCHNKIVEGDWLAWDPVSRQGFCLRCRPDTTDITTRKR